MARVVSVACMAALASSGCAGSLDWSRLRGYHPVAPLLFSDQDILGQGITRAPDGFVTRSCLQSFSVATTGSELEIEIYDGRDPSLQREPRIGALLADGRRRVGGVPRDGPEPISFLVAVRAGGQWAEVDESTARFYPSIERIITRGDEETFFELCGTEVVVSAAYESAGYIFVAYYPPTDDAYEAAAAALGRRLSDSPEDTLQLGLFDELPTGGESYFSVRMDANRAVAIPELTIDNEEDADIRHVIEKVVRSIHNSGRGRLERFETRRWRSEGSPHFHAFCGSKCGSSCNEALFRSPNTAKFG